MITYKFCVIVGVVGVLSGLSLVAFVDAPLSSTVVNDWFRTLCTFFGLILAGMAFQAWRNQERAKRKAAIAESLLMAAFEAAAAIRDARRVMPLPVDPLLGKILMDVCLKIASGPEIVRDVETSGPPAARLRTFEHIARIYFGDAAAEHVRQIYSMREVIKLSLDTIIDAKEVDDLDDPKKWPRGKDLLIHDFENLGLNKDNGNIDGKRKDKWERQLDKHMNGLEQILQPYVAYEA